MSEFSLSGEQGGVRQAIVRASLAAAVVLTAAACGGHKDHDHVTPVAASSSRPETPSPTASPISAEAQPSAKFEKRLTAEFKNGIAGEWLEAGVWPGLAIIPSDVTLHSSPIMTDKNAVAWPEDARSDHLIVQRPIMVQQTMEANGVSKHAANEVGSQVMAFWLPSSDQLVYVDRDAYRSSILLPSNSNAAVYEDNYTDITGEPIMLQPTAHAQGEVWRYLIAERVYEKSGPLATEPGNVAQEVKVVGRSVLGDPAYTAYAYQDFLAGNTNESGDLIQLPREIKP